MSLYGDTLSPGGVTIGRLFGAALLGYAVLAWSVRNTGASDVRQAIILALFVGNTIGLIAVVMGQLSGAVNALGWSTVIIYLLLALGYGYFQFVQSDN